MDNLGYEFPSGLRLEIRSAVDFYLFQEFFVERCYERALECALHQLTPQRPFHAVDLGCNIGYFTTFLADKLLQRNCPEFHITAVDASEKNLAQYEDRLRAQLVDSLVGRVELYYGAVGERTGEASFLEDPFHSMSRITGTATGKVPYLDLSRILKGPIDLLKCDIEGSEEDFVSNYGDLLKTVMYLVIELHDGACNAAWTRTRLSELGFQRMLYEPKGNVSVEVYRQKDL